MSIHAAISRSITEPRIDTLGSFGRGPSLVRLGSSGQGQTNASREDILRLFSTSPWVRLALDVRAARQASATWSLMAPASRRRSKALAIKSKAMCAAPERRLPLMKAMQEQGELINVEEVYGPHPLLTMLRQGVPGQFDGWSASCLEQMSLDLSGEAVHVIVRDPVTRIPVLRLPIPAHWITPPSFAGGHWRIANLAEPVPLEDLDFRKVADPLNPYGRGAGVIGALDHDAAVYEEAMATMLATFRNRMRPDLFIAGTFGERKKGEISDDFRDTLQGSYNAGLAYFLNIPADPNQKLTIHDLGRSATDNQVVQLTHAERDVILTVCRVPPSAVGIQENSNRASSVMAAEFLRDNSTVPSCEARQRHIQARYLEPYRGRPAEFGGEDRLILTYELPEIVDVERQDAVIKDNPWAFEANELRKRAGHAPMDHLEGLHALPLGVTLTDLRAGVPEPLPVDEPEDA
jgi:hypothetical protein